MKIILIVFLLFLGCKEGEAVNSYRLPKYPAPDKLDSELNQSTDLFSWDIPASWMQANVNQFSKANYLIPSTSGSAEVSVSYFGGDAGGIEANVNRWRRQVGLQELNIQEIELIGESYLCKIGNYKVYEIINPDNNDLAFLCSVIPTETQTIFLKLRTYPTIIDNFKQEFIEFSSSFNYNE